MEVRRVCHATLEASQFRGGNSPMASSTKQIQKVLKRPGLAWLSVKKCIFGVKITLLYKQGFILLEATRRAFQLHFESGFPCLFFWAC